MHALFNALFYYLWIAPHVLLAVILVLIVHRKLHRQFPMFFLYTALEILQFGVLFRMWLSDPHFGGGYERLFSAGMTVSSALRFGVIYEVFGQLLADYPALKESGKTFFRGVTVLLLLTGVAVSFFIPGKSVDLLMFATNTLDRTVSLLHAVCCFPCSLFPGTLPCHCEATPLASHWDWGRTPAFRWRRRRCCSG